MSDILDEKIVKIVKEVAELPEEFSVTRDQNLRSELGIDSLGMIDLVMHVENELGIAVGEESAGSFATVADFHDHVRALQSDPVA